MKKGIYNIVWLLPFMALLLFGCTDDNLRGRRDIVDEGNEVKVTFQFAVPAFTPVATRAMTSKESRVDVVDVLVYKADESGIERFAYHRRMMSNSLQMSGNSGSFAVQLAKIEAGKKYTFDFCFNLGNSLYDAVYGNTPTINVGDTREEVQQAFYVTTTTGYEPTSNTTIPMWAGINDGIEITSSTVLPVLKVFHNVARVDVGVNLNPSDVPQGLSNFTLDGVSPAYGPARAYPIPDLDNLNAAGDKLVSPSLQNPYGMNTSAPSFISTSTDCVIADCYIYETDVNYTNPSMQTFAIVIRGNYTTTATDGSTTTTPYFYPIRFTDPENPTQRLPIIRNHLYRINILGISGPGYATAELAAAGEEINIKYDLRVDEAGDINHVVYNHKNYLGVSTVYQEHEGTDAGGQIKVRTDVTGGWQVTAADEDGNPVSSWFTATPTSDASTTQVTTVNYTLQAHSSAPRTAILTFTAGPLSIQTRILQNGAWHIYSDYQTGTMMMGDGDRYNVSVWGNVPANLQVRAFGPERDLPLSRGTLTYTGGVLNQASPETQLLEIIGNAWLPMAIRDVQFQYSTDNGATWVTFDEGPQGKGHFRLRSSGRIVSLYDYTPGTGYTWSEAMGIDPAWDYAPGNLQDGNVYYHTITTLPSFPWTYPTYTYTLANRSNRHALYYVPDRATGCAEYEEEGYESEYPKGRWRLPALQEVLEMYDYRNYIGDVAIEGREYWTSTDQNVTGGSNAGSFYLRINNPTTGLEEQPEGSANPRWTLYSVRCVYDDPDYDVLLEQYPSWYLNPNKP